MQALKLGQEPGVDVGQLKQLLLCEAILKRLRTIIKPSQTAHASSFTSEICKCPPSMQSRPKTQGERVCMSENVALCTPSSACAGLRGKAGHLLEDEHAVRVGHAQPVLHLLPRHALPVLGQAPPVQPSLQRAQSLHHSTSCCSHSAQMHKQTMCNAAWERKPKSCCSQSARMHKEYICKAA